MVNTLIGEQSVFFHTRNHRSKHVSCRQVLVCLEDYTYYFFPSILMKAS
jgi:hypothetical protein